jgi:hypothetical protein
MVDRNPLSGVGGRDQRRLFLSTALATRREKRVALAIAAIALVAYLVGDGGRNITGSVLTIDARNTA